MAKADLTAARLRELLHYDPETGKFTCSAHIKGRGRRRAIGAPVGSLNASSGYVKISLLGFAYMAHRLAWLYVYGEWPSMWIDHINGDRADNRVANLREATPSMNAQNRRVARSVSFSKLIGVSERKEGARRYQACITIGKQYKYLGVFFTPEEAHAAYVEAKRKHHPGNTL